MNATDVASELRCLRDRAEIVDVCVRYATALDARDWPLLRQCFTADAIGDYSGIGVLTGYDEIEDVCRRALEPLAASQHLLGNHLVEVDGDDARAQCYFQAQHVLPGTSGGDNFIVGGTYTDRFVRTAQGWRIAHRTLERTWTEGNSAVLNATR